MRLRITITNTSYRVIPSILQRSVHEVPLQLLNQMRLKSQSGIQPVPSPQAEHVLPPPLLIGSCRFYIQLTHKLNAFARWK
jgi:hypothetical protein